MTNAEKFKLIFGVYATELWAKPEKEFLEWLNADVPDTNAGDTISRQAAIDAIEEYSDRLQMVNWKENPGVPYKVHTLNWCVNTIRELPSAHPSPCEFCKHNDISDDVACLMCSAERRTDG